MNTILCGCDGVALFLASIRFNLGNQSYKYFASKIVQAKANLIDLPVIHVIATSHDQANAGQ